MNKNYLPNTRKLGVVKDFCTPLKLFCCFIVPVEVLFKKVLEEVKHIKIAHLQNFTKQDELTSKLTYRISTKFAIVV